MDIQIKDNQIFAPLKKQWLVLKPEEEVRQKYICRLADSYRFSLEQMAQELKLTNSQRGQGSARADIVIWRNEQDKTDNKSALIVVECKAENVTIRQADYFQGYNYAAWAGADFFVTTNLKETRIFKVVKGEIPQKLEEIVDIPNAETANNEKKIKALLQQTKAFTRDEFSKLLFKCHNIIRNNDKLSPEAAFDEISKILFIKIQRERNREDGSQIFSLEKFKQLKDFNREIDPEDNTPFYQVLFNQTKKKWAKDNLFEKNEIINIRDNSFEQIVKELQIYNLSATSDDVKGIAFEQFLGKTFRGELGQFFTPRTIVDFMTSVLDPQEGEYICDPCCGSGGFLIRSFEYVREQIEDEIEKSKATIKQQYYSDNYYNLSEKEQNEIDAQVTDAFNKLNEELDTDTTNGRLKHLSTDCIYGLDANPRMARTAKMNMIMHGDGHGGVHHHDGLLNVNGIFENHFDVILTNPPFGARVDRDLKISEVDKFTDKAKIESYTNKYGDIYKEAINQINENIGKPLLNLFETGKMSGLTEVLFIERCLNLLKPGGRMGIVLPEGVLNNSNLQKVRDFIESKAKILLIVSIPQDVFIASGATVKPSLLFFKKFTKEEAKEYSAIVENATNEVNDKYKSELDDIATQLAKRNMSMAEKDEVKGMRKSLNAKIAEKMKQLIKEVTGKKKDSAEYKEHCDEVKKINEDLKNAKTDGEKEILKNKQKELKRSYSNNIRLLAKKSATDEFKSESEKIQIYIDNIMSNIPSPLKRVQLESAKRKILEKKSTEIKTLVKQRFNYQIPIAEVQKAGISTTGAAIENELIPLEKEFTPYRKEQKLWKTSVKSTKYNVLDDGNITRVRWADDMIVSEPEIFYECKKR